MNKRGLLMFGVLASLVAGGCSRERGEPITQAELVRRTQEIFDAAATGDRSPWEKYFAPDSMYFDEKGKSRNKQELVGDQSPLPAGYSGSIKWSTRRAAFSPIQPS